MAQKYSVLMVCMGNICRSPTAHGVFAKLVDEAGLGACISVDSAGTHAWHVGNPPDSRSQAAAFGRGYDLSSLRARQVEVADFYHYDFVLAMDKDNLRNLECICPSDATAQVGLFLAFASAHEESEVPDPYYGGAGGFEHVLDLVEDAASGLLQNLQLRVEG